MTIYVDDLSYRGLVLYGRKIHTCHMMTDSDIQELHDLAEKLGLRKYFQPHPRHPHYDLMERRRVIAVQLGAVPISSMDMVKRCNRR